MYPNQPNPTRPPVVPPGRSTPLPPSLPPTPPRRTFSVSPMAIIGVVVLLVVIGTGVFFMSRRSNKPVTAQTTSNRPTTTAVLGFNTNQHSLTDPASPWVIVNKAMRLTPSTFAPATLTAPNMPLRLNSSNPEMQVNTQTAAALERLIAGAKTSGLTLMLASGYRSYQDQAALYNGEVKSMGQAAADSLSARPGYSEHQTGWAADLEPANRDCELDPCFADLPEGKWLAAHAADYGFTLRYPKDKDSITGYQYEPWHFRYVGIELARELQRTGKTLEEFFKLGGGTRYSD